MVGELTATVVVSTLSRNEDLSACLDSLETQFVAPEQVIVVDDGDAGETESIVDAVELNTRYVRGRNRGVTASLNMAVEHVTEDVVCFVDDDVVAPPNWLQEVLRTYEKTNADGVGGTVVNYTPESIQKANASSVFYRTLTAIRTLAFHDRIGELGPMGFVYAPHTFVGSETKPTDVFQGCNMSFRSDVFEDHRFDEWYGHGGSAPGFEIEFCTRVKRDGRFLVHEPRAVVVHKRSISGGERVAERERAFRGIRNMSHYLFEHSDNPELDLTLMTANVLVTSLSSRSTAPIFAFFEGFRRYRDGDLL